MRNFKNKHKKLTKLVSISFLIFLFSGASAQMYYNHADTAGTPNAFPFMMSGGKAVNTLIRAGELGPVPSGQQITKVYFFMAANATRTFTDLVILMAQSTITTLTSGQFYSGPYDTVYHKASVTLTSYNNKWMGIELDKPFAYDTSKSLILFVGQCASTGTSMTVRNKSYTGIRRVWSVGGCPFTPYSSGDAAVVGFGIDVSPITGGIGKISQIPEQYDLQQNYPNPFNPSTKINFSIPDAGFVSLKITDILGREVVTLVEEYKPIGTYSVEFYADDLPSGVYFYTLRVNDFSLTKKMLLLK
ncbi:MAG: T9SS type A sorting domain-containing protein [Ignavibacteria bacterium]|nr:T9SS type A sorting domain-containing protein [Ignavibacteria bacterium]